MHENEGDHDVIDLTQEPGSQLTNSSVTSSSESIDSVTSDDESTASSDDLKSLASSNESIANSDINSSM